MTGEQYDREFGIGSVQNDANATIGTCADCGMVLHMSNLFDGIRYVGMNVYCSQCVSLVLALGPADATLTYHIQQTEGYNPHVDLAGEVYTDRATVLARYAELDRANPYGYRIDIRRGMDRYMPDCGGCLFFIGTWTAPTADAQNDATADAAFDQSETDACFGSAVDMLPDASSVSFLVECKASGGYWYPYETYDNIIDALECVRDMPLALQLSSVRIASMHNDTITDTRMYSLESVNRDIAFWQACADASSMDQNALDAIILEHTTGSNQGKHWYGTCPTHGAQSQVFKAHTDHEWHCWYCYALAVPNNAWCAVCEYSYMADGIARCPSCSRSWDQVTSCDASEPRQDGSRAMEIVQSHIDRLTSARAINASSNETDRQVRVDRQSYALDVLRMVLEDIYNHTDATAD